MKKKLTYLLMSLALIMSMLSCEVPAPDIPDKGKVPFQRPQTPQNVQVVSGQPDRITISWDHQDDATGFIIYGSRISDIGTGMKPVARVRENVDTVDLMLRNADYDASQSYIFMVRAYKQFEGSSDILYSLDSAKKEGAFAPSRIDLNVALTKEKVKIYYNSPNLYSGLNSTQDITPLYNAKFTVMYKDVIGDDGWVEPSTVSSSVNYEEPTLYTELVINDEQFLEGRRYLFKVIMDIEQPDGSFYTITSKEVELIVSGDMLPSPVRDISVSQGTSLSAITVNWVIPPWTYPVSRDNSYFTIERSEDDGKNWHVVLDEISTLTHDERITSGENNECSFIDSEVTLDRNYLYRITNAAVADMENPDKSLYMQDEVPVSSTPGYLYRPDINSDSLIGTWNTVLDAEGKPTSANVTFAWNFTNPYEGVDITWGIRSIKYVPGLDAEIGDVHPIAVNAEGSAYCSANPYSEVYEGTMYAKYYYALVMQINGVDYYQTALFKFPETSGDLILGKLIPVPENQPLIEGLTASTDRYGKVVLNWTVKQYPQFTEPYVYQYKFRNDAEYKTMEAVSGRDVVEGESITFEIPVDPSICVAETLGNIYVKVSSGLSAFIPGDGLRCESIHLPKPEAIDLRAYFEAEGEYKVVWNKVDFHSSENIQYGYELYRNDVLLKTEEIVDITSGLLNLDASLIDDPSANLFKVILYATNSNFTEEGKAVSDTAVLLPVIKGINASKGTFEDKVNVEWTACSIPGVTYNVYRYGEDINDRTLVGNVAGNSISDTAFDETKPNYTVAAVAGEFEGLLQKQFADVKNPLGMLEPENKGYLFGIPEFAPVVVSHISDAGELKPYVTVELTPDKFISDYEIIGAEGDITYKFKLADFAENGETYIANGKDPEAIGYARYDFVENKAYFNVAFTILDEDLTVSKISVKGSNGTSMHTVFATGEARRALTALDYANIFNAELKTVIGAADTTFGGDWYGGTGWNDYAAKEFTSPGVKINNTSSDWWQDNGYPGFMNFTSYDGASAILNSLSNISLVSTNGGKAGYLDIDPLNTIGLNGNNNTTVNLKFDHMLDGNPIVYKDAEIAIDNISKYDKDGNAGKWSGSYIVTIKGQSSVRVDINNITTKPY